MELKISERKEENTMILDLSGDLDMGEASNVLRNSVRETLDAGISDITLDLADISYLDSSGLGELISSVVAVTREGGRLILLNPTDQIQRLLAISQLTELFDIKHR